MKSLRRAMTAVAALFAVCCVVVSCEDEKHSYVANMKKDGSTPTMVTTDVMTLISDSGYTRYHIDAPVWRMYEDLSDPYWKFPDGIQLEQYDDRMRPTSNMRCDSATYFSNRRLWRLDGHVVMVNSRQDTFLTPQLFWDQQTQRVYSDSFMHITRQSHIIEGYGFDSNQRMTEYSVRRPTAIIPVDRSKLGQGSAEQGGDAAADTVPRGRRQPPLPASRAREALPIVNPNPATPSRVGTPIAPVSPSTPIRRIK